MAGHPHKQATQMGPSGPASGLRRLHEAMDRAVLCPLTNDDGRKLDRFENKVIDASSSANRLLSIRSCRGRSSAALAVAPSDVAPMSFLEDPRGRRSEELAFEAELASKRGDRARALELFAEAAQLEYDVAREVPADQPRVRSMLAISAVALWIDARSHDEAIRAARELLSQAAMLTEAGRSDLQSLLERALRERAAQGRGD